MSDTANRLPGLRDLLKLIIAAQSNRCALLANADADEQRGVPSFQTLEELELIAEINTRLGFELQLSSLLLSHVAGVTAPEEVAGLPQDKIDALGRGQEAGNCCPCVACVAKRRSGPRAPS